jgi:hypothetical protein
VAVCVSALANLAHAAQFGQKLEVFTRYDIPNQVYEFAFGAILPFVSILFARVLSDVVESEQEVDPEIERLNHTITEMRTRVRESERLVNQAEQRANQAEMKLNAVGDIFVRLVEGPKRERVLAAKRRWPELSLPAICILTGTSKAYASQVLNGEVVEVVEE